MLVLARKVEEAIVLDGRIRISVLEVHGGRVKLGIEAPRDVPVRREGLGETSFAPRALALTRSES